MTTLATDGKTMAADSQITGEGQILGYMAKVIKLKDGRVFGGTGWADDMVLFTKWMQDEIEKPSLDEDFGGLILTPEGKVFRIGKKLEQTEWIVPASLGSGGDIALGAMLAGKSPKEAVEIAALRDVGTGGEVIELAPISD